MKFSRGTMKPRFINNLKRRFRHFFEKFLPPIWSLDCIMLYYILIYYNIKFKYFKINNLNQPRRAGIPLETDEAAFAPSARTCSQAAKR